MPRLVSCAAANTFAADTIGKPPRMITFARFSAEPVDALWAQAMEARILDEFAQKSGLELLGLEVHCRTSLRRVQLTTRVLQPAYRGPSPGLSILREPVSRLGLLWRQIGLWPADSHTETLIAHLTRPGTKLGAHVQP
jgi:hypothetical protein